MAKPKKKRVVRFSPGVNYFKPRGVPLSELEEVVLTIEELEAARLADFEGLSQVTAAEKMSISQSTFHRVLRSARRKIAESLVSGKAIKVEGGDYKMIFGRGRGAGRGLGRGLGRGGSRGRMGGPLAAGPGGVCVCPSCGYEASHQIGVPCFQMKCEKCGSQLARKG